MKSIKHAWHWDIGFLRDLAAKVLTDCYKFCAVSWVLKDAESIFNTSLLIKKP